MVKLTDDREITAYKWVHPDDARRGLKSLFVGSAAAGTSSSSSVGGRALSFTSS
jgi:hypothetical protein